MWVLAAETFVSRKVFFRTAVVQLSLLIICIYIFVHMMFRFRRTLVWSGWRCVIQYVCMHMLLHACLHVCHVAADKDDGLS